MCEMHKDGGMCVGEKLHRGSEVGLREGGQVVGDELTGTRLGNTASEGFYTWILEAVKPVMRVS